MWPALFGSGWIWSVLVAAALLSFIVGILGFLFLIIVKPPRQGSDDLGRAWHLYEDGDLTPAPWERRLGARHVRQAPKGLATGKTVGAGHP